MRICILHGSNDVYGASKVLADDATVLAGLGHDVRVCLPTAGPLDQLLRPVAAVHHAPLAVIRRVSGVRGLRPPARLPLPARSADVVVCWTLALAGYLHVARLARKVAVCSVHEILDGRAGALLAFTASSAASVVVVNSRATGAWLRRTTRLRREPVVMYPVAPEFNPVPKPRGSQVRLLLPGRVNGHKGHLEGVSAVKLARSLSQRDITLSLLGGSYPGQEVHLTALRNAIATFPWASYDGEVNDITGSLHQSHGVLMPSARPEPFGIVALEAWAAGRRVIGSDDGGLSEAIRLADGIPVRPHDLDALAAGILKLLDLGDADMPDKSAGASTECTLQRRQERWAGLLSTLGSPR